MQTKNQSSAATTMRSIAPIVLRFGMAFVFIWFGITQLHNPLPWISYLPQWTSSVPITAVAFVRLNGLFELVSGILLVFGAYTRFITALLALHLFAIAISVGFDSIGIRDFGLAFATTSMFLYGSTRFSVDCLQQTSSQ